MLTGYSDLFVGFTRSKLALSKKKRKERLEWEKLNRVPCSSDCSRKVKGMECYHTKHLFDSITYDFQ